MNVSDLFTSNTYNDKIVVRTDSADLSLKEVKKFIGFRINEFLRSNIKNVLLLGDNHFDFIINFWAAVFAGKNIYLLADKKRICQLNTEYILPDKVTEKSDDDFDFICHNDVECNFFTSGSTGTPKGVVISHRSVIDFIDIFTKKFNINQFDIIGNQAPFDFDVSVKDIYSTIKTRSNISNYS